MGGKTCTSLLHNIRIWMKTLVDTLKYFKFLSQWTHWTIGELESSCTASSWNYNSAVVFFHGLSGPTLTDLQILEEKYFTLTFLGLSPPRKDLNRAEWFQNQTSERNWPLFAFINSSPRKGFTPRGEAGLSILSSSFFYVVFVFVSITLKIRFIFTPSNVIGASNLSCVNSNHE